MLGDEVHVIPPAPCRALGYLGEWLKGFTCFKTMNRVWGHIVVLPFVQGFRVTLAPNSLPQSGVFMSLRGFPLSRTPTKRY